ncbi:hypothetical protein [Chitinophaga sp. XS-30]|uniref:hypothetical protein n=1 Tax=Chitinophaga sp. XS-30 TaxID=2604421 RepID=UPI0011DD239A|nr:hypothetical protein [Chitinophaga sp. XS-30]QEH40711.1 hypothetical protein FW415_07420 [Chitinophaga sp. XS-30]
MKTVRLLLMALAVLAFASCSRQMHTYVPNPANVPLLKEKNEFKANLSLTNWQAAYAVSDNIAVMVNGQYVWRNLLYDSDSDGDWLLDPHVRGGLIEGGVGFFKAVDSRQRAIFDVYAGYGNGSFKTLDNEFSADSIRGNTNYQLRTKFHKFFIQPTFGFSHKVVEAAFSTRISVVRFYDQTMGSKVFENDDVRRENFLKLGDKAMPFFEPTFTVRAGYRYIKWHGQLLISVPINDETYSGYQVGDFFQPVSFSTGISLNFGQWVQDAKK